MQTDPKHSKSQSTDLLNSKELIHPASALTLIAMRVWERCFAWDQVIKYRKVPSPPLPKLPELIGDERQSRLTTSELRVLDWEMKAKAARYPTEIEEYDYQYRAVPGWKALRLPGSSTTSGAGDPLLILCPTALILQFWECCQTAIQLAPFRLGVGNSFQRIPGPILTLQGFHFMVMATIPMETLPSLPMPLDPKAPAFSRESIDRVNEAYTSTTAALGAGSIWAPILP